MKEALDNWRSRLETVMSETLIFHWIHQKPRYGQELINLTQQNISESIKVPTIYSILNRGKSQGLLVDFVKPEKDKITRGKERKYYRLSEEGNEYYYQLRQYLANAAYLHNLLQIEDLSPDTGETRIHQEFNQSMSVGNLETTISLSKQDYIILGYLNLFRTTTYANLSEDLDYNLPDIMKSIAVLNTFYEIESTEKLGHRESGFLLKLKGECSNLLNLIFANNNKTNFYKIENLFFEDIINLKLITGILILKREISGINSLVQYFTKNKTPILSKIKYGALIRYIALISLNQYIEIHVTPEGWILCKLGSDAPKLDDNTILPGYDWINSLGLIGWLSTKNTTNLSEIANWIKEQTDMSFEPNESALIIALLVTDGIIEAKLEDDSTLHILNVRKDTPTTYLSRNERVLLGFLISNSKKNLYYLQSLLGITRNEVQLIVSQFTARSNVQIEIARDGSLITSNLDTIPISIQAYNLPDHLLEILGFLNNKSEVKIENVAKNFETREHIVEISIYELAGYGVIEGKLRKDTLKLHKRNIITSGYSPQLSFEAKEFIYKLEMIDEAIIGITQLSKILDIDSKSLSKQLAQLIALGVYSDGLIDLEQFIKNGEANLRVQFSSCVECGQQLRYEQSNCPNCHLERDYCLICRGLLYFPEKINACPNCMQKAHKEHFTNWLQIRSECPSCRTKIEVHQLE